jgi:hypothetical protein
VHLICVMGVSERFACRVTGQNRTTQRRPPTPTDGRPVKIVSIVDEHTRECLDELDRVAAGRSSPAVLGCDNGPELACQATADWAGGGVGLSFIPPGEPWRNG